MKRITLILGGARSGKSSFAVEMAKKHGRKIAFIPTCIPKDSEMKERVKLHRESRPAGWIIYENPGDISGLLRKTGGKHDVIILDCLTLLVSGLMMKKKTESQIEKYIAAVIDEMKKIKAKSIIVSNEVGLGLVPVSKIGRDFRDTAGRMNMLVSENADSVYFMVSGIPVKIK